jgi:phosphatidate cytidylyltransferase
MKEAIDYLFSTQGILAHPVTKITIGLIVAALVLSPILTLVLTLLRRISPENRRDVWTRYYTWLFLIPVMMGPILLCPAAAMATVCVASLLCYREYARATGLFRCRMLSALVGVSIFLVFLTSVDHWYRLFLAMGPLAITAFAAASVVADEPKGYLQRVSLASVGFLLLGSGLGHLGYMANDRDYRPILCLLIVCVQFSDIIAYVCGKWFGSRKLFPNTSPNKTLGGHLGALLITAPFAAYLGHLVFRGTPLDMPARLAVLGLIVAVGGQVGDLVLGSIKRDIGIKDMASTLPGHGGFLDRVNSLMLVAPAAFHYINVFVPFGLDRAPRVFTGP